jgi:hypothetical protein
MFEEGWDVNDNAVSSAKRFIVGSLSLWVLTLVGIALVYLDGRATATALQPPHSPSQPFTDVQVDFVETVVLRPIYNQAPLVINVPLAHPWTQARHIIGWSPWVGLNRGSIVEGHLILRVNSQQVFLRGPHKEAGLAMYDETGADFFPAGTGYPVRPGDQVSIQFLLSNTSNANPAGGQANVRIYSTVD